MATSAVDEQRHPYTETGAFERLRFGFFDPSIRIGGYLRTDYAPAEGVAGFTACCSLPDGTTTYAAGESHVGAGPSFDSGDVRVEVVRAMEELSLTFDDEVLLVEDAHVLSSPEAAGSSRELVPCRIEISLLALSPAFDDWPERAFDADYGAGGYQQLAKVTGHVSVGDNVFLVDGFGIRQHSWGKGRPATERYCWLAGNAGPTFGFGVRQTLDEQGSPYCGGFVWDGTSLLDLDHLELALPGRGDTAGVCEAVLVAGRRQWRVQGRPLLIFPVGPGDGATATAGIWRWTLDDGRVGYGSSEVGAPALDGLAISR